MFEQYIGTEYNIPRDIEISIDIWNDLIRQLEGKKYSKISPDFFGLEKSDKYKSWKNSHIEDMNLFYKENKHILDKWLDKHKNNFSKLKKSLRILEWNTGVSFTKHSNIYDYFIQVRPSGLRVRKNNVFPTLVRSGTVPIIGQYKRYITPKECARLQSFPDSYMFINDKLAYKQLGNSVNVEIMEIVIKSVLMGLGFF
jgi:DNA (cytosine-5)-methyltransferase 1